MVRVVVWEVVGTSMFEDWYLALDAVTQNRIDGRVEMLEQLGPAEQLDRLVQAECSPCR